MFPSRRSFTLLLPLLIIAGCGHERIEQPSAAERLSDAEERILAQRRIKQYLLNVDPIERQIESHLRHDPRVASARFSISTPQWGDDYTGLPFYFAVVVTTHKPMSQAEALQLLDQACASANCRIAHWDRTHLAVEGNTWGTLIPINDPNPDLSSLPYPATQP